MTGTAYNSARAIRHLPNETQLTIGVAVVSISREYRQDETVVFDR